MGSRNLRALAWALGIIAALGAMSVTRHHIAMMNGHLGGDYLTWGHAFRQEGPVWIFWGLAVPVVFLFVAWVARQHWSWPATLGAHVVFAGLIIGLAFQVLESASTSLFAYTAILGGVLAYYYSQRFVDREVEVAGAKLHALQAQLRPHFMFNALNSVAMLVRGNRGPEAVEMIARVSDLLRDSLDADDRTEVSLEEELALARRYLAIEEVRFADRLQVQIEVSDAAKPARVPRLILQPLVENAVRHGIGGRATAGHLQINARTAGKELIVTVRDDGPGLNGGSRGNGVGLKNTRERLATLYGSAARLTLEHGAEGGAVATLVVPLK